MAGTLPNEPRRQSTALNLLLSLAVTVGLAAALEGAARVIEARRPPSVVADYIWNWEQKWEGDFYTIRSEGVGWPPWEEFNGDGLRDRTHPVETPAGVTRIAFLGDSVTLGAGIEAHQAYPQRLQQRFDAEGRPVDVLNVSLWGWSTRQERLAWSRIARRYAPRQVVLGVCLNDIPELQNNLTQPPRLLTTLHDRSALVRVLVDAQGREIGNVEQLFEQPESAKVREAFDRFFAEVRALRREVRADGAEFALVVFPFRFQVLPGAPEPSVQRRIAAFCQSEGLRCLDALPALHPLGDAGFVDYDHLTPAGADRVAAAIVAQRLLEVPPTWIETLAGAAPGGDWAWTADTLPSAGAAPAAPKRNEEESDAPPPPKTASARTPSAGAIERLVRLMTSQVPSERTAATWALGRSGPAAAVAVPALAAALEDADPAVRRESATALGAIGEASRPAVADLFRRLADDRDAVRFAAADALHAIGVRAADVPALATAIGSADPYVRGFAAWSLGSLGAEAAPALPALIAALAQPDAYGRAGAASAIARMGSAGAPAVPALLEGLRSSDGNRRWKSARALGRIGSGAAPAVPALTAALGDPNEFVRRYAARALGRIGPAARPAAAELERRRADPDDTVRREAQDALERLGR